MKSYKYRIYPTQEQALQMETTFNACRFVYNWGLEQKIKHHETTSQTLSGFQLTKQLVGLVQELSWLKTAPYTALQQTLRNLDKGVTRASVEGRGFPSFKSKRENRKSYRTIHPTTIRIEGNKLTIPKIKNIKIKIDRQFEGKIKNVTISKTPTGKYFASILVDDGKEVPVKESLNKETAIGLDLGLKHFLIDSTGNKVDNPKFLRKSEEKLKQKQRQLSRKKVGSINRDKARKILAILHEKVANQRKDFLHKLSTQIVHENQGGICVENLNVSGMVKNRCLSKSISDVGWAEFKRQLTYKCEWYGKNLLEIGKFEPSSKTCSTCGAINQSLELKTRDWTCQSCGSNHDRDINAARNIRDMAFKCIGKELPESTLVELNNGSTMKQEILKT